MKSVSILRSILAISAILVLLIYFLYPTFSWPTGLEALECLLSFAILLISIFLIGRFRTQLYKQREQRNITIGLYIGFLWTIEICINNIIQPGLPLRDIIDNIFWALIACLILYLSIGDSFQTKNLFYGIKAGFLSGFSSGAIACLTALILISFGMQLIVKDPLNIKEWSDIKNAMQYPNIAVYFAYQTMAGAIMHLVILGAIMGAILGTIGGIAGKLSGSMKIKNKPIT